MVNIHQCSFVGNQSDTQKEHHHRCSFFDACVLLGGCYIECMAKKSKEAVASAMGVDTEYRPTIEIDEKMYKGVANLKIDQVVNLSLKVKVKSISRDRWNNNKLSVRGEIQNASPEPMDGDGDE